MKSAFHIGKRAERFYLDRFSAQRRRGKSLGISKHGTHDEARAALARSWAEVTGAGKSALLVASRNDDVRVMNELAREAVRERLGDERSYATDFGERAFAIGDTLVGRCAARALRRRHASARRRDDRVWYK